MCTHMCTDMYMTLHTHILMHVHMCTQRYLVCSTKLHLYNCLGCLVFPRYSGGLSDKFHWLSALPGRSLTPPSPPSHIERHADKHEHLCRGRWAACWASSEHLSRPKRAGTTGHCSRTPFCCLMCYKSPGRSWKVVFSLLELPPLASEKRLLSQEES